MTALPQRLRITGWTLQSPFLAVIVDTCGSQPQPSNILTISALWSTVELELSFPPKKLKRPPRDYFISTICKPMRFAIYARKSTESVDRQVQSLNDQIRELRNLASRENYTVVEIFQESRSAKAPGNRPEFDLMLSC